jgi:hypothetical protein
LCADHAPLVICFLHDTFLAENVRAVSQGELSSKLEDSLFQLRERYGADRFPKSAAQYLDDWAHDERGWLRKYHVAESDEAHFDLTPAAEKAIQWLVSLPQRDFVSADEKRAVWSPATGKPGGLNSDARGHTAFDDEPITLSSLVHLIEKGY